MKTSQQYDIFNHFSTMRVVHTELISAYKYDKKTGLFYKNGSSVPLGTFNSDGYVQVPIFNISYKAHRLAWFYIHGKWPIFLLDHKNGKRYDNRIKNLRDVTQKVNAVKRPTIVDKKGPFDPKGKKHYVLIMDLVAKEQQMAVLSKKNAKT